MNISIIGAGNIGGTLGKKWAEAGHRITFGVRNPADPKHAGLSSLGRLTSVAESIADADVVLLSLPGSGVADFAAQHGSSLAGKIVIDATNNPRSPVMNNLEILAAQAPQAHLVRAFSTLGWENFANPQINGQQIDLFYCGHAPSRPAADRLISEIGLRPIYLGGLEASPAVDGLTRAWFALVFGQGRNRRLAFKLLEEN
jgi:predicted dinucleotide-binding enzyme